MVSFFFLIYIFKKKINNFPNQLEFTQECSSKGISLVFELGDEKMRNMLVSSLVSSLTAQGSSIKVSEQTQLFEGEMGQTPEGGNISTYKELCSLASELNQPDLVYKFMNIANSSALWNTKKGAAFGFTAIAARAKEQLTASLPALVPKLYRYQHDPNPKIQESMVAIWKALVSDPEKIISQYFHEIISDLVSFSFLFFFPFFFLIFHFIQ